MARAERSIAENRKARHDYFIEDVIETGIVLTGTEVKSLRLGRVNLRDSFARLIDGEMYLFNCHIAPYEFGNRWNHEPYRNRKLLLHRKQIRELGQMVKQKGLTLIPLRLYFDEHGRVKLALAVARGKKLFDKRDSMASKDAARQIERMMKQRVK
jgi:SsrA-binding protein